MDKNAALLSDESEDEVELVDQVGLNLCDTKKRKLCSLDIVDNRTPTQRQPSNSPMLTQPIYNFGCRWDSANYSCSYDCVFMTFAWVYFHATEHWRATWAVQSQSRAIRTLSDHLRLTLSNIESPADNRPASHIAALFSQGRDALRDVLSEQNPTMFRRRGPVDASLVDIFASLSQKETSSKYYSFIASCGGPRCKIKCLTPAGAPYMLTPQVWGSITHSGNSPPYRESLQEWVTRWFDWRAFSSPHSCTGCHAKYSQTQSFLQPSWIWFEIFVEQPNVVLPAFQLSLSSHAYRLAAVIYGNGCHFIAHLSTPSGTWWRYDGQANGGKPTAAFVTCEEDLMGCGDGRYTPNVLVYCPA